MKTLLFILITILLIFISCNNTGFSEEFKENFRSECIKNAKVNLSHHKAERYCNCVLGVVMTKYSSDSEADRKMLNMSMNDMMGLIQPCQ